MGRTTLTPEAAEAEHQRQIAADLFTPPSWRGRLAGPFAPVRMASIGIKRAWPLLLAVILGMLVAVTLISTVPIYSSLVADVQVQRELAASSLTDRNIEVVTRSIFASQGTGDASDKQVAQIVSDTTGPLTVPLNSYLSATTQMTINAVNEKKIISANPHPPLILGSTALLYGFDFTSAQSHIHLFAGAFPHDPVAGQPPEVLVTDRMSEVHVGDVLTVTAFGGAATPVTVRVSGIWYPNDTTEPYWNGAGFDTHIPTGVAGDDRPPTYPLVGTTASLYQLLNPTPITLGRPAQLGVLRHYVFATQPYSMRASHLADTATAIKTLRGRISGEVPGRNSIFNVTIGTRLDKTIARLQQDLSLLALPLYVIVLQVIGLALLFVVAMAGLLIESQATEIATLRSRGASSTQVLLGYTLQGLLLAGVAGIAGPFLAHELSYRLISAFIPFSNQLNASAEGQHYLAGSILAADLIAPAVVGALLGATALVIAAIRAARLEVLALRREQGRETRVSFWRRYYLDLGLAIACIAGYVELSTFGGLDIRSALGNTTGSADPLLLVSPALLLLAGSLLLLRLFPLGARFGAWLAARRRGATGMLAFSQLDRSGGAFSRLVLLLTLAVGMAAFALNFQSTLALNAHDRADYVTGADERLAASDSGSSEAAVTPQLQKLPGVSGVTAAYRTVVQESESSARANVLAVNAETFAAVAKWRSDEASQPLTSLMSQMVTHRQGAQAGDAAHPIWALIDTQLAQTFHLRVGDRFNRVPDSEIGRVEMVVGGIVSYFPTMFDSEQGGCIVIDLHDYLAAVVNPGAIAGVVKFPNEYWVSLSDLSATTAAKRLAGYQAGTLSILSVQQRASLQTQLVSGPLASGMTGLLLLGAFTALALGVLGSIAQSVYGARSRLRQFAILRTLGMSGAQISSMLVTEQVIVYAFGLACGTALGLALTTATLPFMQFNLGATTPDQIGVPPYIIAPNLLGLGAFYGALLVAFALALILGGRIAASIGLGRTLRIGED